MHLNEDLKSARWIYAKGILFVLLAMIAGGGLVACVPRLDVVLLLVVTVWASCRAYYFAFYVIEHYVDPGFRFSGLFDFAKYVVCGRRSGDSKPDSLGPDRTRQDNSEGDSIA